MTEYQPSAVIQEFRILRKTILEVLKEKKEQVVA